MVQQHLLQRRRGQQSRECAFGSDRARSDGHESDSPATPLHRQAAHQRDHAGFGDGAGHHVCRAGIRIRGCDVQHHALVLGRQPAPSARQRHIDGAFEHDANHGFEGVRRQFFGARQKIAGRIVHQHVERALGP